ncbi:MAG: ATPase [Treponema sp.]|jgi:vacuolar-type H+-ATPase subunit E/Vma4|nr:ATPase [Treponema sp.]
MEELQSTEVLDREILEDARRKAQRILKTADETVASGTKKWERKTEKALKGVKDRYAARLEASRSEIMARLPLDKRRTRLSKIEALLKDAASFYLAGLSRSRLLAILEGELKKRADELDSSMPEGKAAARGLSGEETASLLKKVFPQGKWTIAGEENRHIAPGTFPALIVDTQATRITVSADAVIGTLLLNKRAELAAALLGEGALDA